MRLRLPRVMLTLALVSFWGCNPETSTEGNNFSEGSRKESAEASIDTINSVKARPDCNDALRSKVIWDEGEQKYYFCSVSGWADLVRTASDAGAAMYSTADEPQGSNCPFGGTKVMLGIDRNQNGTFEADEINGEPSYICHTDAPRETTQDLYLAVTSSGDDENTCTFSEPCRSIRKAISKIPLNIQHRVEVRIEPGTYIEQVDLVGYVIASGASLRLYGDGGTVVIDGQLFRDFALSVAGKRGAGPLSLHRFQLRGARVAGLRAMDASGVLLGDIESTQNGDSTYLADGVLLTDGASLGVLDDGSPHELSMSQNSRHGLRLQVSSRATLDKLASRSNLAAGISVIGAAQLTVQNVSKVNSNVTGLEVLEKGHVDLAGGPDGGEIGGDVALERNQAAVIVQDGAATLSKLVIRSSDNNGISVQMGGNLTARQIDVRSYGPYFGRTIGAHGIMIENSIATLAGVTSSLNPGDGLYAVSSNITVMDYETSGTVFTNNSQAGLYFKDSTSTVSESYTITGNSQSVVTENATLNISGSGICTSPCP